MTRASPARLRGMALVTAGAVLWSTAGLFVRGLDLDVWTIQAWRAFFGGLSLLVLILYEHRGRTLRAVRAIGRPGLVGAPVAALSMVTYVAALKLTTVANVLIVYATLPFIAAAIAYLWSRERSRPRTLAASAVALCGIAVMAGGSAHAGEIIGLAFSLVATATFAVLLVMARRYPGLSLAITNALGAFLCFAVCWPLSRAGGPTAGQLAVLAVFGVTTTGLAYLLFLTGGRLIPSGEAGLIGLLDTVLGPAWVWLAFDERPTTAAILGGILVLAALVWSMAGELPGRGARDQALGADSKQISV